MSEAIREIAEKPGDGGDISEWTYETIKHLRSLLLGRLVEITGVVWSITHDVCKWDLKFNCRYGFGSHEILSFDLGLEKAKEAIDALMDDQAWMVAKTYWKRMEKRYEVSEG